MAALGSTPPPSPACGLSKKQMVIAAAEVKGRKIAVFQPRPSDRDQYVKGKVVEYSEITNMHLVSFETGLVEAKGDSELWLHLAEHRFYWPDEIPKDAVPNPSYKPALARDSCVGKKLKVFWPLMGRFYTGVVKDYNASTDQHHVAYKDGDHKHHVLRHEAVIWLDDVGLEAGPQKGKENGLQSLSQGNSSHSPRDTCAPVRKKTIVAVTSAGPAGATGSASKRVSRKGVLVDTDGPAAGAEDAPRSSQSQSMELTTPNPCAEASSRQQNGGEADGAGAADSTSCSPAAAGEAGSSGGASDGQGGGSRVVSGASGDGDDGAATATSPRANGGGKHGSGRKPNWDLPHANGDSSHGHGAKAKVHALKDANGNKLEPKGQLNGKTSGAAKRKAAPAVQEEEGRGAKRKAVAVVGAKPQNGRNGCVSGDLREAVVGARVGVLWEQDKMYYRGKLVKYHAATGKHQIQYDDGELEWLALEREQFKWYLPRGRSGGYTARMRGSFVKLGAQGLEAECEVAPPQGGTEHQGQDAVGWHIEMQWAADGKWYPGEVVSYSADTRLHLVLYLDGEHEWLELRKEAMRWLRMSRSSSLCTGICTTDTAPRGRAAIGWRIAVYWRDDHAFYDGRITGYDNATGKHEVLYDDGETEAVSLHGERIVWKLPSGCGVALARKTESMGEEEGGGGGPGSSGRGGKRRRGGAMGNGVAVAAVSADSMDDASPCTTPTRRGRGGSRRRGGHLRGAAAASVARAAVTRLADSSRAVSRADPVKQEPADVSNTAPASASAPSSAAPDNGVPPASADGSNAATASSQQRPASASAAAADPSTADGSAESAPAHQLPSPGIATLPSIPTAGSTHSSLGTSAVPNPPAADLKSEPNQAIKSPQSHATQPHTTPAIKVEPSPPGCDPTTAPSVLATHTSLPTSTQITTHLPSSSILVAPSSKSHHTHKRPSPLQIDDLNDPPTFTPAPPPTSIPTTTSQGPRTSFSKPKAKQITVRIHIKPQAPPQPPQVPTPPPPPESATPADLQRHSALASRLHFLDSVLHHLQCLEQSQGWNAPEEPLKLKALNTPPSQAPPTASTSSTTATKRPRLNPPPPPPYHPNSLINRTRSIPLAATSLPKSHPLAVHHSHPTPTLTPPAPIAAPQPTPTSPTAHPPKDPIPTPINGSVRVASALAPPTSTTLRNKGWPPSKTSPPTSHPPTHSSNGIRLVSLPHSNTPTTHPKAILCIPGSPLPSSPVHHHLTTTSPHPTSPSATDKAHPSLPLSPLAHQHHPVLSDLPHDAADMAPDLPPEEIDLLLNDLDDLVHPPVHDGLSLAV